MIGFDSLPEYVKDLKRLNKKFSTLNSDMEDVKKVLRIRPDAQPPLSYRIDGLGITSCVIKVKKIASDSFKGRGRNSGFRLIYAYFKKSEKIVLVELYHKGEKENEDRERILKNFE
jgi:mRNA-degrading endonuclease RelE of RelBE toxin-antitoxin system